MEIERKFIVNKSKLTLNFEGSHIIQGYLSDNDKNSVRVRQKDDKAYLTIKSAQDILVRDEFEYLINFEDASYMLKYLCLYTLIEKTRYDIEFCGHAWVVDIFNKENKGLVLAEIELNSENENFERPEWLLEEVTDNVQYYNHYLAKYPFSNWNSNCSHSS